MQAHDMPFTRLINVDDGAREHFHVPKYQREYTWGKGQWDQLFNDIDENEPGYFMGSIICVCDTDAIVSGSEILFEVVDGQQRLTTISLLLMAIYTNIKAVKNATVDLDQQDQEDISTTLTNIRNKLVKRKKGGSKEEEGSFSIGKDIYLLRVQPSAQNQNLEDYRFLLKEVGILEHQLKPAYCGNRRLSQALSFFQGKIPDDLASLEQLLNKINQLMFVQITVNTQSDAFTLFESLNNRGVLLFCY